jgi:hypothetical protein
MNRWAVPDSLTRRFALEGYPVMMVRPRPSGSELVGVVLLLAVFLIAIPLSYAIKSTRHQRESSKADEGD